MTNILDSMISKDMLLRSGWHKMRVQPIVGVENALVEQVEHHQFHNLLDMILKTTCPMLLLEQLGENNVQYANLVQMCTVLNVRYIHACSITEIALNHFTLDQHLLM